MTSISLLITFSIHYHSLHYFTLFLSYIFPYLGVVTYVCHWRLVYFKRTIHYLKTGELLPEPTAAERAETALRHARMLIEYKGEYIGVREMRRHLSDYTKGLPGAAAIRGRINCAESYEEIEELVKMYFGK